ncbi:GntR family transcriptional regulator [Azorhizobium oxalatiphilum]|uniref:GntR family transcriptional regulator n=1 Tax=Azorhizobium oxalatiphilum TaxID=980631 RepID=UPI001667F470|nr:GntR family transcriptional regulator [Azorhizobium oxalatiphilum]
MTATRPARPPPPVSLAEQAVERLREKIVFLELPPGAPLSERRLVEELGGSRTPVREALKLLAAEGLVLLRHNRAAIVAPLAAEELQHLFEVEVALESFAAELAASRMSEADIARLARFQTEMEARHAAGDRIGYIRLNQKIHAFIVAGAGNPALSEAHARLIGRLQRARNVGLSSLGRVEESILEHRQILDALRARNAETVRTLMAHHVGRTGRLVAAYCAEAEPQPTGRRRRAA